MIIALTKGVNGISQKVYEDIVESIDPNQLKCPKCNHTGTVVHAYYTRKLKTPDGFIELTIKRVRCSSCGSTHAILLDLIVPYSWITREDTLSIITSTSSDNDRSIMQNNILIDESDIYRTRRNYRKHWKERVISFQLSLDSQITEKCVLSFRLAFMQIRRTLSGIYRCHHTGRQEAFLF